MRHYGVLTFRRPQKKPDLPYNYCCSTASDNAFALVRLYLRSQLKAELSFNEEQ